MLIWAKQFKNIRDGDRWWFENTSNGLFTRRELREIKQTKVADIFRRNTNIGRIPDDAFYVPDGNHHDHDDKRRHGGHDDDDDDDGHGHHQWANLCI